MKDVDFKECLVTPQVQNQRLLGILIDTDPATTGTRELDALDVSRYPHVGMRVGFAGAL